MNQKDARHLEQAERNPKPQINLTATNLIAMASNLSDGLQPNSNGQWPPTK